MDVHKNARLTPAGREGMVRRTVEGGQTPKALSAAVGVCPRTVRKWVERFRAEGVAGLRDRSSRPHRLRRPTPAETVARIEALRRQRWTGAQIAGETGVSKATVSRVLRRLGLNRLKALELAEPIRRYERENPGELIHIDIKKLGRFNRTGHRITGDRSGPNKSRGAGWEFVHVCIDDASRVALCRDQEGRAQGERRRLPEGRRRLLRQARRHRRARDDRQRLLLQIRAFARACKRLGLKHIRTRPYTPKTNGKAERFIQTALREWAYAKAYQRSDQRGAELPLWLHRYNWHRPHGSLGAMTPISRLGLSGNNLLRLHT